MKSYDKGELSPETWLIREDMIRPGDVLLTRGKKLQSVAIAFSSGGKFSHTAVFVSPHEVFESYDLVEHAAIQSVGCTLEVGQKVQWAVLPHDPIEAELWRHPKIDTIPTKRFETVYDEMMRAYWGLDYSR